MLFRLPFPRHLIFFLRTLCVCAFFNRSLISLNLSQAFRLLSPTMKIVNLIFPHLENPQSPEVNNDAYVDHISKSVWQYFQLGIGMVEFSNHTRPSY